jgi:hypothetical protein
MILADDAHGHHSSAMFDFHRRITLSGTVKEFQWTNPHCWIQVLVMENGSAQEWSIEMGSPMQLYRGGWKPGTLHPGDQIEVIVNPKRNGARAGQFVSAVTSQGTPIGISTARAIP